MLDWITILFAVIGALLGVYACRLWINVLSLLANGIHTEGEVVGVAVRNINVQTIDRSATDWCFPIVSYTTLDGRHIQSESKVGSQYGHCSHLAIGTRVKIVYRTDKPATWSLDDWLSICLAPLMLGTTSVITLLVAWLIYVAGR
jgi:hypothetical protein